MMVEATIAHLDGIPADKRDDLVMLLSLSPIRRACIVDGIVLGIYGVVGQVVSIDGIVWLYLTDEGRKRKVFSVRTAIKELRSISPLFRKLAIGVDPERESDHRFAAVVGFKDADEVASTGICRPMEMRGTLWP